MGTWRPAPSGRRGPVYFRLTASFQAGVVVESTSRLARSANVFREEFPCIYPQFVPVGAVSPMPDRRFRADAPHRRLCWPARLFPWGALRGRRCLNGVTPDTRGKPPLPCPKLPKPLEEIRPLQEPPVPLSLETHASALQIAEHSQDVAEDFANGRIYLPREDLDRFGVTEDDLAKPSAGDAVKRLMAFQIRRARQLLDEGAPLAGTLNGAARLAISGYIAGGRAALKAIEDAGYDVLAVTPKPGKAATLTGLVSCYLKGR